MLEFWVAGAARMPHSCDFNSPIPVIIEDADGADFFYKVNFTSYPANELAVVGQVSWIDGLDVHVFAKNLHEAGSEIVSFTFAVSTCYFLPVHAP